MKAKTTEVSTQPNQAQPNGDDPAPVPTSCPDALRNKDGTCSTTPDVITGAKGGDDG